MNSASQLAFDLSEQELVPDVILRRGIRYLIKQRIKEIGSGNTETMADIETAFVKQMSDSPVALVPEKANEQHYEIPAEFFIKVLGPRLKYSSGYWGGNTRDLAGAETAALQHTVEHAQLQDGQKVLELGCGWGSLTLWMAAKFPGSRITAVSNSASQRLHINRCAQQQNLNNIEVVTADMNSFVSPKSRFDRIVSVEMFEHMRNWAFLYKRIAAWLKPGGKFFKHIFVHNTVPYAFEDKGPEDWMSRYFFSGGMMPSDDLPLMFQSNLELERRWRWDGTHYEKTANAWLCNMDRHREELLALFAAIYGEESSRIWWVRWRLFFMACAETFGYRQGQEWYVSHYLFEKPAG